MSIQLFFLDKMIRFQMKRRFQRTPDPMLLRRMMKVMERRAPRVPAHVTLGSIELGGVRTETLTPANADERGAVLYIHGGAFLAGSPVTHRGLTWRLADGLGVPLYAVDYRLAPEHRFPAGLDDIVAAYRALLERNVTKIRVAGDSAGGNLTLALTLKLKSLGLPLPSALVCLSPVTDLAAHFESHESNARSDAMFDARLLPLVAPIYCADPSDPLVSPLRGDVSGFPPTLIQCSAIELFRDDGVKMADALRAAGVVVELDVWPAVYHVWQLSADILPEGRRAIEKIIAFLKRSNGS
jgi:acetyl esterase/lipase